MSTNGVPTGDEGSEVMPWEQQPREPRIAYACFCVYRDLGTDRSLTKAYREAIARRERESSIPSRRVGSTRNRATGQWHTWSRQWEWEKRAQAWDNHLDRMRRDALEGEHLEYLREHMTRRRKLATVMQNTAIQMLTIANRELSKQDDQGEVGTHTLKSNAFGGYVRAAMQLADVSGQLEQDALGVNELISALDPNT